MISYNPAVSRDSALHTVFDVVHRCNLTEQNWLQLLDTISISLTKLKPIFENFTKAAALCFECSRVLPVAVETKNLVQDSRLELCIKLRD